MPEYRSVEPVAHAIGLRTDGELRQHQPPPRLLGKPLAVHGGKDSDLRAAIGQLERRSVSRRAAMPGRPHREDITGPQRPAPQRAHRADEMRGATAEGRRKIESALDRKREARAL